MRISKKLKNYLLRYILKKIVMGHALTLLMAYLVDACITSPSSYSNIKHGIVFHIVISLFHQLLITYLVDAMVSFNL